MWVYEKKLQYPVKIKNSNPALAKLIISQYGGPHGELGASLRYLSQRYTMPYPELKAILTDIGTEAAEMFHISKSAKNPYFDGFLLHTLWTTKYLKPSICLTISAVNDIMNNVQFGR